MIAHLFCFFRNKELGNLGVAGHLMSNNANNNFSIGENLEVRVLYVIDESLLKMWQWRLLY